LRRFGAVTGLSADITLRLEADFEVLKSCRLARHRELWWRVAQKLALQWSPERISGWLRRQFPADKGMRVSHETIYRRLFIQTRGVLKRDLMAHVRTARQMR
jgi:IS30 family transposase